MIIYYTVYNRSHFIFYAILLYYTIYYVVLKAITTFHLIVYVPHFNILYYSTPYCAVLHYIFIYYIYLCLSI